MQSRQRGASRIDVTGPACRTMTHTGNAGLGKEMTRNGPRGKDESKDA